MVEIGAPGRDDSPADGNSAVRIDVPIAPGWLRTIDVRGWRRLPPGAVRIPRLRAGMIALDGEREVGFGEDDEVRIVLEPDAVRTVDVEACMDYAARHGLFRVDGHRGPEAALRSRA